MSNSWDRFYLFALKGQELFVVCLGTLKVIFRIIKHTLNLHKIEWFHQGKKRVICIASYSYIWHFCT